LSCAEATEGVDSWAGCGAVMGSNYATGARLATLKTDRGQAQNALLPCICTAFTGTPV
jgi:hypothetical protein